MKNDRRNDLPEQQYLDILSKILAKGTPKPTRQIDDKGRPLSTIGIPGAEMTFNLQEGFPLLSTRGLGSAFYYFIGELFWILSGSDKVEDLHAWGITYWDHWCTEEACERHNLPTGTFGRTYGPQWRGFRGVDGAECDQMQRLFHLLRTNPNDKRMRVIPWHPCESDALAVRPCHGDFYIYYDGKETLSMIVTQMSADMPIGIPSNLVMYAFLLHVLCEIYGFTPGTYTHRTMDTHIYSNQVEAVKILCAREARQLPVLKMDPRVAEMVRRMIEDNKARPWEDADLNPNGDSPLAWLKSLVSLEGYEPQAAISRELLPVAI